MQVVFIFLRPRIIVRPRITSRRPNRVRYTHCAAPCIMPLREIGRWMSGVLSPVELNQMAAMTSPESQLEEELINAPCERRRVADG